jgi:hypothetical protein
MEEELLILTLLSKTDHSGSMIQGDQKVCAPDDYNTESYK